MIAILPEWIVDDGQLPPPVVGETLLHTGLRAHCLALRRSREEPGTVRASSGHAGHTYELHGIAGPARDFFVDAGDNQQRRVGAEFALNVGSFQVVASTPLPEEAVESGVVLVAECQLTVIADYEWEAFALVDARRDWLIATVENRQDGDYVIDLQPLPEG